MYRITNVQYKSKMKLVSLILLALVSVSVAEDCDDVDTTSCELLANKGKDVCNDPCLSNMCKRFCGKCPVKCYQCHEIDDPANCTTLVACPSVDHYCFTTQTFKDDFTEVFKLGCAMKDVCQNYLNSGSSTSLIGKRNIDLNGACCTQDSCNNNLPLVILSAGMPSTNAPVVPAQIVSINTTGSPTVCENVDENVCTRMAINNKAMCSDHCMANLCPRMCGQCFNCYTCNDINQVNDCNVTDVCQAGEECFSLETLSFDLRPVYRVGCMQEELCKRFTSHTSTIFGKRDGFTLKGGCCTSDLCNNHIDPVLVQTTTQAPTTHSHSHCPNVNHGCPSGYLRFDSSCYRIGHDQMTWQHAQDYCKSHCGGRLVDFTSRQQMFSLFEALLPHQGNRYQDTRIWTDGYYSNHHWVWSHSGERVDSQNFRALVSTNGNNHHCAEAIVHTAGFSTLTEDLIATSCLHHHLPLCEISA